MSRTDTVIAALTDLTEPICARVGVELVEVRLVTEHGEKVARIMIDRERSDGLPGSSVSLDDCQDVSRALSALLDEQPELVSGAFRLEVSSPGLERPLTKPADYARFAGRTARLKTFEPIEQRRTFEGTLVGTDGTTVQIDCSGRIVSVPLSGIAKANLVHRFA